MLVILLFAAFCGAVVLWSYLGTSPRNHRDDYLQTFYPVRKDDDQ